MANYDEIINFNYLKKEDWKKYAEDYIVPIYKSLEIFSKLRIKLEDKLRNNLKNEFNSNKYIQEILLGGVNEQGEYNQNSLAMIYDKFIGIKLSSYKKFIYFKNREIEPFDQGVSCEYRDIELFFYIEKIKSISLMIFTLLNIPEPQINDEKIKGLIEKPENILEWVKKLYISILKFSKNYNQQTFFIINTACVPKFYLMEAYPQLRENWNNLVEILKLREVYVPPLKTENKRNSYTIWGHSEEGLGFLIFSFQELIEVIFKFSNVNSVIELITENPIDLKTDYTTTLREIGPLSSSLDFSPYKISIINYNSRLQLILRNDMIVNITNGYAPTTSYAYFFAKTSILLEEFIKKVAPYLFLGVAELRSIKGNDGYFDRILEPEEINDVNFLQFSILRDF